MCRRLSLSTPLLAMAGAISLLLATAATAESELTRHLNEQYKGKTFILRGFYPGGHLTYDATGHAINPSAPADWTVAGVVLVEGLSVSGDRLRIQARRLHLGWPDGVFQDLRDYDGEGKLDKNEKKNRSLIIEADLGLATVEAADAVVSQIFLTSRDNFSDLVPDYWKPCVLAASTGTGGEQYSACRFSPEFALIPGVALRSRESAEPDESGAGQAQLSHGSVFRVGQGIAPPKIISQTSPSFSNEARHARYQGTGTLSIVVDKTGQTRNVRILRPLGAGLDQRAVETVMRWRFNPAIKEGEPVAVVIAVETDFHLY